MPGIINRCYLPHFHPIMPFPISMLIFPIQIKAVALQPDWRGKSLIDQRKGNKQMEIHHRFLSPSQP